MRLLALLPFVALSACSAPVASRLVVAEAFAEALRTVLSHFDIPVQTDPVHDEALAAATVAPALDAPTPPAPKAIVRALCVSARRRQLVGRTDMHVLGGSRSASSTDGPVPQPSGTQEGPLSRHWVWRPMISQRGGGLKIP